MIADRIFGVASWKHHPAVEILCKFVFILKFNVNSGVQFRKMITGNFSKFNLEPRHCIPQAIF